MQSAFDASEWHDFSVMVGGAAAALAGLLVVAMSINLGQIVADVNLTRRAGTALIMLVIPLVIALVVLIPAQSDTALGLELLAVGVVCAVFLPVLNRPNDRGPHRTVAMWVVGSALPMAMIGIPVLVAGAGVLASSLGGLYWLPVAVIAALGGGLLQAWVLLIEVLR